MWFWHSLLVFVLAAVAGMGLLGVRSVVRGSADPFSAGWPLDLEIGSLTLTLLVASLGRRPFAAAFGLYCGLVVWMVVDGQAEYPVASLMALAVHGLLPSMAGALCFRLMRRVFAPQGAEGADLTRLPHRRWDALRWIRWFVWGAWGCGFASVALVWCQSCWYVFHPHHGPLVLLFLGLTLSTLAAVVGSAWRTVRGPHRWRTAMLLVAAFPPVGFWCYVGAAAHANWSQRWVPNTFTMRAAKVMGATFMRLEADWRYRRRLESDRIVMYYDPEWSPYVERVERPEEDLAAMDRHLARLEELLGDRITGKVYWIRGPLLEREYLSLHGLSLGSAWSTELPFDLTDHFRGDRHELAHAALDWFRTPASDPPYVLHEGWAMAQCGDSRFELAQAAAKARTENPQVTLRDLFGPAWYYRDSGLVYSMGGAFVDFLIRTYDARQFRRLYAECTPGNVDSKCREIFHTEFDALETAFWEDVNASLR